MYNEEIQKDTVQLLEDLLLIASAIKAMAEIQPDILPKAILKGIDDVFDDMGKIQVKINNYQTAQNN